MSTHNDCKHLLVCEYHKGVGDCPEDCNRYRHKDEIRVVRCKDCKHWHKETGWCYHHSHFVGADGEACHPWESSEWKTFDDDDYCSFGERKDDEAKIR